jgi:hypothetical protein
MTLRSLMLPSREMGSQQMQRSSQPQDVNHHSLFTSPAATRAETAMTPLAVLLAIAPTNLPRSREQYHERR